MSNGHYLYERAAVTVVKWLHLAEDDLVGRTVGTANGEAGTCLAVRLDDEHGLCFTMDEQAYLGTAPARRWYPVATIKHYGMKR